MAFEVAWVYVVSFVDLFAVSLTIPLLSAHLRSLGASHFLIGFMGSVYAGCQLVSGPIVGSWSDKKGRQMILIASLLVCTISYILLGIFDSLCIILLLRVILGLFKHVQVLTRIIVADRVAPDEQSWVSGRLASLGGMGFMVGPAIGGHLAEFDNGFGYVCYCTALLFIINIIITYTVLQDPPAEVASNQTSSTSVQETKSLRDQIRRAVRDLYDVNWTEYWDIFALKFLLAMSLATFTSNYSLRIQDKYNVSPKWAGYTISFQGLTGATPGFIIGWLEQRFYKDDTSFKRRNLHGFVVMVISYVGVFIAPSLTIFMLWTVPLRISSSLLRIVGTEMVLKRCPPSQRGSLVGTGNSVSNVARLLAPLIAGVMGDCYGTDSTTLLSAAITAIGVSLSMKIKQPELIHSKTN